MASITTIQSRTKSGAALTVAIIPVSLLTSTDPEARNYEASALAVSAGCGPRAWRLVSETGAIVQLPSRTAAAAAATSAPDDRRDW